MKAVKVTQRKKKLPSITRQEVVLAITINHSLFTLHPNYAKREKWIRPRMRHVMGIVWGPNLLSSTVGDLNRVRILKGKKHESHVRRAEKPVFSAFQVAGETLLMKTLPKTHGRKHVLDARVNCEKIRGGWMPRLPSNGDARRCTCLCKC